MKYGALVALVCFVACASTAGDEEHGCEDASDAGCRVSDAGATDVVGRSDAGITTEGGGAGGMGPRDASDPIEAGLEATTDTAPSTPTPTGNVLAEAAPTAIATDSTNVYWIGSGGVWKLPLSGGSPVRLAAGQGSALEVDAGYVYWVGDSGLSRVALGGGAPIVMAAARGPLALDAAYAYYVTDDGIVRAALDRGAPETLVAGVSPGGIAVDATGLYFTNAANGTVMKVALGGGTPTEIASAQARPGAIAVDTTSVYWTNTGRTNAGSSAVGTVMSAPLGGGAPVTLASGQMTPVAIAVDAAFVYWTNAGTCNEGSCGASDGTVMKVPLGGGDPVVLASSEPTPLGIELRGTSAYWGTSSAIMAAPIDGAAPAPEGSIPPLVQGGDSLGMVIDATYAYWIDTHGGVLKGALDGSSPAVALTTGQPSFGGIAVGTDAVYFTSADDGTVRKVALAGGAPSLVASAQVAPGRIFVDATNLYWATTDGVMAAPLGGGSPALIVPDAGLGAIDATNVYFMQCDSMDPNAAGTVMSVSLGGGSPVTLGSSHCPTALAIDAANVYFTDFDWNSQAGTVWKVPLGGGAPASVASVGSAVSSIASDGASVFWMQDGLNAEPAGLWKASLAGGAPETLVPLGQSDVRNAIAVDATRVYWMRQATVMGVIK